MFDSRSLEKSIGDLPSEILTNVLQDIQKVQKTANVVVDMNASWCIGDGKTTAVCLAGAVIMMRDTKQFTKTIKDGLHVTPDDYDAETAAKLYAINGFRLGIITKTLREYRLATEDKIAEFSTNYGDRLDKLEYNEENPMSLYLGLNELINKFKSVGL